MMTGRVNGVRHCTLALAMQNGNGRQETVTFEIDTGFSGFLMLPASVVSHLLLPEERTVTMRLADGTRTNVTLHNAILNWHGTQLTVSVVASGKQPLLGTGLLEGSRLTVDFVVGGPIILEPLH